MAAAPRLIDTDLHNDLAGPRELLPFFYPKSGISNGWNKE